MYISSFHSVSPCFVTSFEQVFCTVTFCFVTNETNETDHQWELLLVCYICFILFLSILEYFLYILIVTSVSVTEKKTCPKKTCVVFVQYMWGDPLVVEFIMHEHWTNSHKNWKQMAATNARNIIKNTWTTPLLLVFNAVTFDNVIMDWINNLINTFLQGWVNK